MEAGPPAQIRFWVRAVGNMFVHVSTRFDQKEFSEVNSMQESKSKDELFNSSTADEIFTRDT